MTAWSSKAAIIWDECDRSVQCADQCSRRTLLKLSCSSIAIAGLPAVLLSLAAVPADAGAQATGTVTSGLQLALKLEYLESAYYRLGLANLTDAFTPDELAAVQQISKHETAHVAFLQQNLGVAAPPQPADTSFDFTGGSGAANGPFSAVFTNKLEFFKLAQLLEDMGVRAYKGQVLNLMPSKTFLTAALQFHSVEARHASRLRRIRGQNGWITEAEFDPGFTTAPAGNGKSEADYATAVYAGENNATQLGVPLTTYRATEAFDEPLTTDQVTTIVAMFGVS